jgi:hypothetical protein
MAHPRLRQIPVCKEKRDDADETVNKRVCLEHSVRRKGECSWSEKMGSATSRPQQSSSVSPCLCQPSVERMG